MGNVVVAAERLPKLEDYLCFAVYSANLPLHRLLKPLLDEVGLTYPQYLVLIALYDDDHQTVGGLGDKFVPGFEHAYPAAEADGGHGIRCPATRSAG